MSFSVETDHFIITYNEPEKACIDEVVNLLEVNYTAITERLCRKLKQKTKVEICSDINELHCALGIKDGPEWIRGGIISGKTVIASPLDPPPGSDYYNVIHTVIHEFVHVILREINPKIPRWLDEGIASFEGRDNSMEWIKNTIKSGLENDNVPALMELDTGEDFEMFFNRDGYQYSYTLIEFIIDNFGYNQLIELVKNPSGFEAILKMTEKEFQSKWMEFLKNHYL